MVRDEEDLKRLPQIIANAVDVPVIVANACQTCAGNIPMQLGSLDGLGYSKIIDRDNVVARNDSREEDVLIAEIEIRSDRTPYRPEKFGRWRAFTIGDKVIDFVLYYLARKYFAITYYHRKARHFLK